jgi:hypothetical protein
MDPEGDRVTPAPMPDSLTRPLASAAACVFGFVSGVVRNARTFHPDGRTFRATVRSIEPPDPGLVPAAKALEGAALLRVGMGVAKKTWPRWLAKRIPDAPSIATRFFVASGPGELGVRRREGEDLDLLCTAGGDRLARLILNLGTGGRMYDLDPFDYLRNLYYAQVPYRIEGGLDVWIRLAPSSDVRQLTPRPASAENREEGLTRAVASHAIVSIEVQRVGSAQEPFVPIAEIRFEEEVATDQEALHFDPVAGRGFEPHGLYTELRKRVYPTSARSRAPSREERLAREHQGMVKRLVHFLSRRQG